jgi:hypothetical protein
MIQFINGMGVSSKKTTDCYLSDSTEAHMIPVHLISCIAPVKHKEIRILLGYSESAGEDDNEEWTAVEWAVGTRFRIVYLNHRLNEVMMAISFLNTHGDRTTCFVDDHSEKSLG